MLAWRVKAKQILDTPDRTFHINRVIGEVYIYFNDLRANTGFIDAL